MIRIYDILPENVKSLYPTGTICSEVSLLNTNLLIFKFMFPADKSLLPSGLLI
jgi:hypothetical protein